jgi:small nuclear ribonucleoprotein G
LNGNRKVTGFLRGYDQFMNLVLDNTIEEVSPSERNEIGMVVCVQPHCYSVTYFYKVIRGNSVVMMEPLEKI